MWRHMIARLGGHVFVYRWWKGQEADLIRVLLAQAADPAHPLPVVLATKMINRVVMA